MQDFPYIDAKAAAELCGWSYQKFQRIAAKEIPHQRFSDLGNRLYVHCRTGSLERACRRPEIVREVHCRTGSLEISCD